MATTPESKQAAAALYKQMVGLLAEGRYVGSDKVEFLRYMLGGQEGSEGELSGVLFYFISQQSRNKAFFSSIGVLRGWVQNRMMEGDAS